jgi:uncharacterized membrane protein
VRPDDVSRGEWTKREERARRLGRIAATVGIGFLALGWALALSIRWRLVSDIALGVGGFCFVVMCVVIAVLYRRASLD